MLKEKQSTINLIANEFTLQKNKRFFTKIRFQHH